MRSLHDFAVAPTGEMLELVPSRYVDGSLALVALEDSGQVYDKVSVNLHDYGITQKKNTIIVPEDAQALLNEVDGVFDDDNVITYGFNGSCTARAFTFGEDAEAIADDNVGNR